MTPQRGEIYLVRAQWRKCEDIRPGVVVDVEPEEGLAILALVSAAMELYDRQQHFLIPASHPDFKATGLHRDSYCAGDEWPRVGIERLGKRLGRLQGQLAVAFEEWIA
jgi:mRNA-degrading endonuclease toxin of MazEF toxin-antitoxin module